MEVRFFRRIVSLILFGFIASNFFSGFGIGVGAQTLQEAEVQTLQVVFRKMQLRDVTVTPTFCNDGAIKPFVSKPIERNITCNCSYNDNTVCHVTNITLKGLSMAGELPAEFQNLTYLIHLDLTRNYLGGSIPSSLSHLPLTNLSLLGNRLNGQIPPEMGDIATLEVLVLESNNLEGLLPPSLGNLSSLRRLTLSANNFTGRIPESFGKLKNLTDFRIAGNTLSGRIPEFIGNWTQMDKLDLQGTSMEGPIPSAISLFKNLTELRISDLRGSNSSFPDLKDMKNMKYLILRNCLIRGTIPDVFEDMTNLVTLDLSSNLLSGEVPKSLESLGNLKLSYMFLTNNSLSGAVPSWILTSRRNFDLSYNNFTGSPPSAKCQQSNINLVSSYSDTVGNNTEWCLRQGLPCGGKARYTSLFINCGGEVVKIGRKVYEEDTSTSDGPGVFASKDTWAYSSTGTYISNSSAQFIARSPSTMSTTLPQLYRTARLAPQSLKYYGLCMRPGPYKVELHFAEIIFSNGQEFSSLGRRIFDVAIQGQVVLEDFNIMEQAGGAGKNISREFNVTVNGSTLEIHLYWKGKGTTVIPYQGAYGPLISAIAVTPNYKVGTGGLSAGAIAGIVVSSSVVVALLLVALRMKGYLGGKDAEHDELRGLDLQTGYFTLRQIKAATGNFHLSNKIGEGGFGPVYKGVLSDGAVIAVKQLSSKSKQGNREFVNEIGMISAVQHPNLVRLYGCCIEGNQLLVVYEYMENNSLARALFGPEEHRLNLDWTTRKKICLGIARGLAYLHEESRLKIVHRDIKATNVLLDKYLNAKISDFGLAKLDEEENTHISTRIAGTVGYMAPEYATRGYLTDKADVYSFGVVVLEIVSGKSNTSYRPREEFVYLLDWAYVLEEQGSLLELVDPALGSEYKKEEALTLLNLALLCANPSPTLRPSMSSVVSMIEGKTTVQAPIIKRSSSKQQDPRFKAFEKLAQESQRHVAVSAYSDTSQDQRSISIDGPWFDSSTSIHDETGEHPPSSKLLQGP